jgi:hypothetical protein
LVFPSARVSYQLLPTKHGHQPFFCLEYRQHFLTDVSYLLLYIFYFVSHYSAKVNIKSVITAVGTVKATVGAIGAVAVFSIILPPIVYTVLYKLAILLCAIFSKMLGLDKESDFLYEINSLFNVLVAIMCGTGMLFIISVAVFAKTGVNA